MQVENDISAAINIMNMKKVDLKQYRPVKIFPNYSLKTLKKYKLNGRKVLTKCNSTAEVLDLVSYGADVTCYSSNRLDEYFLKLQFVLLNLKHNEYMKYIFNNKVEISKELYDKVKDKLDEHTRYFFDELYRVKKDESIFETKLCNLRSYDKQILERFIRYFLKPRYYETFENLKINTPSFILCKDVSVPLYFEDNTFSFINLSYNIDNMDKERINYITQKVKKDFNSLLTEYGKIQIFTSTKEVKLEGLEIFDTRSIKDPNTENSSCKKDYAYMYIRQ